MVSEYTDAQAQADADALLARLEADPGFREALLADPRGTLADSSLPEHIVAQLAHELAPSDVEGFAMPAGLPTPFASVLLIATDPAGAQEKGAGTGGRAHPKRSEVKDSHDRYA